MLKDFLKDRFIPHEKNDFRPDFLERASMGMMLFLVILTFAITNIQALLWISSDWLVSSILPAVIVEMTNDERADGSLGALKRNSVLDAAAKLKAEDMAKNGYFAHYSPAGVSPWHWFDEVSYNFIHAGENLAVHFTDSGDVVEAWMESPTHRANIMNGNFTEIGVGTAKGTYDGESTIFVVQLFGTPSVVSTQKIAEVTTPKAKPADDVLGETTIAKENSATETVLPKPEEIAKSPVLKEVPETVAPAEVPIILEEVPVVPTETETQTDTIDGTVVMYSDLATTSREGVPVPVGNINSESTDSGANSFGMGATRPGIVLQFVYAILAFLVVGALMLSIIIEWRRQNPLQIAYASVLLLVMAGLYQVHVILTGGVVIL